jgi:glycosyltransferase involved in cell wall biosynthesis
MKAPRLSIIVPMLDEAEGIAATLSALRPLGAEVIAVDGGSLDGTIDAAAAYASWVIDAPRGRARQMNAGAAIARGEILLFLHADTALPAQAGRLVGAAIAGGARWGRFDVRIAGASPLFPLIAAMMNLRSRLTGIATGDQAIFVHRDPSPRSADSPTSR